MAVAKLIGLWIYDELSFNKYHHNYDRIARVMEHVAYQGKINTSPAASPAFGNALRLEYGNDFTHVLMASNPHRLIVSAGEKKLMKSGYYFEPGIAEMLSLKMRYGTRNGLQDPASVLLSESVAKSLFGDADPVGKVVTINQVDAVKVTVYMKTFRRTPVSAT
jgi:hypothetical protein